MTKPPKPEELEFVDSYGCEWIFESRMKGYCDTEAIFFRRKPKPAEPAITEESFYRLPNARDWSPEARAFFQALANLAVQTACRIMREELKDMKKNG